MCHNQKRLLCCCYLCCFVVVVVNVDIVDSAVVVVIDIVGPRDLTLKLSKIGSVSVIAEIYLLLLLMMIMLLLLFYPRNLSLKFARKRVSN